MSDIELIDIILWKEAIVHRVFALRGKGVRTVTFRVYRRGDISDTHTESQVNSPDEVQFDGVIFDDDTAVIHWNTAVRSTSVFTSFIDLLMIHGHPERAYLTEFCFEGE